MQLFDDLDLWFVEPVACVGKGEAARKSCKPGSCRGLANSEVFAPEFGLA